jgi:hypothetical protein
MSALGDDLAVQANEYIVFVCLSNDTRRALSSLQCHFSFLFCLQSEALRRASRELFLPVRLGLDPAVRIKTLLNFALNRVGEFAARALEIACDFVLGLLQSRRDQRIEQTPQQPGPRSLFSSSGRRDGNNVAMVEEII